MKILMVLDQPNLYGSELHFLDLATYFSCKAVVEVIVFNNGPLLRLLRERNIHYKILQTGWLPSVGFIKALHSHIQKFSPDIVHSHQPKANFISALIKPFYRAKLIVSIHSHALDHSLVYKNIAKRKLVYFFHRSIQFFTELVANKIIYVSNASSKTTFFRPKVIVLHNWLSEKISSQIAFNQRQKEKNQVIKIVAVGSVTFAKGYDLFIDFVAMFKGCQYKVDVVGSDNTPFAASLKEDIKRRAISNVTFHHYQDDISPYLMDADYFVLFSRSETFGLCYIEAMAFGLPVFTLDYPTMREIIPAGNSISNDLSKHFQYLVDLRTNICTYQSISAKNSSYVLRSFSYEAAMSKYESLYKNMIDA